MKKLPDWLVQRWTRIVSKEVTLFPSFSRFTIFITKESDILCNPILSNLQTSADDYKDHVRRPTEKRTFATDLNSSFEACVFCRKKNHEIARCNMFIRKTADERRTFIMKEGLCFSCLKHGHRSRQCQNRKTCDRCKGRHPTSLCGDIKRWKENSTPTESTTQTVGNPTDASTLTVVNERELDITTMIVPIDVFSNNSDKVVRIYALQDSQSDSTFILDSVADQLEPTSENTKLRLSTMTNTSIITSRKINNLKIRGVNNSNIITIPTTYTRNIIPVRRSHIPTMKTAEKWKHLRSLRDKIPKLQEYDIGMLIGYNSSEAIKPRAVISGMQGEPYGIETQIGWSIVGATHVESESARTITLKVPDNIQLPSSHTNETHYTMRTSCKEIVNILESDFVERRFDNQTVSQDDIRFMKILKKETRVDDDGFYELPLPFKKERPILPDNKIMAQKRLEQLRKKLEKNCILYDE